MLDYVQRRARSWYLADHSVKSGVKKAEGDLISLCNSLKGDCSEVGISLLSQVTSIRTRKNGPTLPQKSFRMTIRKDFFTKVITTGRGCPGKRLSHHPWSYLEDVQIGQ